MNIALGIFLLAALAGFGLITAGVFVLLGLGYSLITGGLCFFAAAIFVRRGLTDG